MHSPLRTQAFAHLREASGPSPVRRMSMMPAITADGSALTPPGPVTGQTSTHLPQRVQASAIAATRAESALSKLSVMLPRGVSCETTAPPWGVEAWLRAGPGLSRTGAAPPPLGRHRDALHLDHHLRLGEPLHGDRGARREVLAEQFRAQLGHAGGVARVDEEHRHGHHVAELRAGLGERLLDIAEGLLELRVEIGGERFAGVIRLPGVPGDIDGPARAFSDDAGRERALDLPCAANERFFHSSSDCNGARRSQRAWPSRIARQSRSGVAGISTWRTPRCASASTSALATAGMAPTQPASPAPLTPSGLVLVGTGLLLTSTALMSVARGMA